MKLLTSVDTMLEGKWKFDGKAMSGDETCNRIEYLVTNILKKVADGNWETLFQDPGDSRYWERTYPEGHMHGGGPPTLRVLSKDEAAKKYAIK